MDLLTEKPKVIQEFFLKDYGGPFDIDFNRCSRFLKTKTIWKNLTRKWYRNLKENNLSKAYEVYNDQFYFIDLFNCFKLYSRIYLKRLQKENPLKDINSFVDIGCGIGYSTWVLRQIFPKAVGYATEKINTDQWAFTGMIASRANFKILQDVGEIDHAVDLVFASEYFEHIQSPIIHLKSILDAINPKYLVIANSFNTKSIGHFKKYEYEGREIDQSKISRLFNKFLINNGYHKEGHAWNDRPIIWRRNEP